MRHAAAAIVILVAVAALPPPARAERSRFFPTLGGGVVVGSEDTHGHLWVGAIIDRPTARDSGRFVAVALDTDFHEEVVTVGGTLRAGWMTFFNRRAWLHAVSAYALVGGGFQLIDEEAIPAIRFGVGISVPPILVLLRAGLAVPSTLELVIDAGDRGAVAQLRLSWGF